MVCFFTPTFAWNAEGHRIIGKIAYDHLTPEAKKKYAYILGSAKPSNFVNAATWLDYLRVKGDHQFDNYHYINLPFSEDGTSLPDVKLPNAVQAIELATKQLYENNTSRSDKEIALRILLHVVGDIHQPLHAATRVSKQYPNGDLGGTLFELRKNSIGSNLHEYWDKGGGYLKGMPGWRAREQKVKALESEYPCSHINQSTTPMKWALESHLLAIEDAYPMQGFNQKQVIQVTKRRLAQAGCRLANLLNK